MLLPFPLPGVWKRGLAASGKGMLPLPLPIPPRRWFTNRLITASANALSNSSLLLQEAKGKRGKDSCLRGGDVLQSLGLPQS